MLPKVSESKNQTGLRLGLGLGSFQNLLQKDEENTKKLRKTFTTYISARA